VDFDTRLRRLGVPCSVHVEPSLPHGFVGLCPVSPAARRALASATRFLRAAFHHPAAALPSGAVTSWAGLAK
jgi:acetyl esterase/lipase